MSRNNEKATTYIKSPLNYIGGKYKLLDRIIPQFPEESTCIVDLFTGGMNIGINADADTIYANDNIDYLIEIYEYFQNTKTDDIIDAIKEVIEKYSLDKSNAEGYNRLRKNYNANKNPLMLFVLTCYSFNHQIRFNHSLDFNVPFGKERSSYNKNIESNLIRFADALKEKNIILTNRDFRDFDFDKVGEGGFVYCDPPYLITTGSYNDGKRGFSSWTKKDDSDLLELLDTLDEKGVSFMLSNVLCHKGQINKDLLKWSKRYDVIYLDKKYSNCSYHFKERDTETAEVIIKNY